MEDKNAFFEKYKHCADSEALAAIWRAKETKSTLLNLSYKKVNDLTPLIDLTQLEQLSIQNTLVSDLKPLKDLTQLQQLSISSTQVNDLMPLKDLTQLQQLYFQSTKVSDLTPLKDLSQLQQLYLQNTKVSDLTPLKDLIQLQKIDLNSTQVSDLTPLKGLIQLQKIDFKSTQVSDLTPLKGLIKLQKIDFSSTQVSDLTPLKDLIHLQQLYFQKTKVNDLTPLKDLTHLEKLSISETKVKDLKPLKDLIQLQKMDLYLTLVRDLTPLKKIIKKGIKVYLLIDEVGINVKDCPLSNPPKEIVEQGNEAILNYWKQIEEQGGTETINEAKLIIVGEGKSGKTTLFKKLIQPYYQLEHLDETHGINIHEGLKMEDGFRVNLWDFGGQELQYMTHQFFLTPRALYVLMMDARAESPNLAYWFKIISLLGKDTDSEKVSLLLVFNKRKGSIGTNAYYETLKYYENDFDYIPLEVDFNENDYRWECLKETIQNRLTDLPIVKNKLPKQWIPIREALRKEAKIKNYITTDRLTDICSEYQVNSEESQFQLTKYLHQLGSLLHFQNDPDLSDTVILSPQWAVEGVYTVLKNELIKANHGKFKADDIFNILKSKKYSHGDANKILKLMSRNNFDVCYKSESGLYVATQLLPDNTPPQYKWDTTHNGALQFRYQYPIMPKGLMSRLIVRLSDDIEKDEGIDVVWKKGVILNMKIDGSTCRVMMKEETESKTSLMQIVIEVLEDRAPYRNRKYALQKVRQEVESLHKKWFKNIHVEQIVPCNCDTCKILPNPFTYELSKLLGLTKGYGFCNYLEATVSLSQLLEGVYGEDEIKSFIKKKDRMKQKEENESSIHQHFTVSGGTVNVTGQADKVIVKQEDISTPSISELSKEPKPWYEHHWVKSVGKGLFAASIVALAGSLFPFHNDIKLSAIAFFAVSLYYINQDPKYRYYRLAAQILGGYLLITLVLPNIESFMQLDNAFVKGFIKFTNATSDYLTASMILLVGFLIWMDFKNNR